VLLARPGAAFVDFHGVVRVRSLERCLPLRG
jgi:hypothetical protein